MLILGNFPPPLQFSNALLRNPIVKPFLFSAKTQFSLFSNRDYKIHLNCVLERNRSGFCAYASKNARKAENNVIEMEDIDQDDDFLDEEEEEDDLGEGEEDDEDMFIPLANMKKWLENRPPGFGEGKVYDTSVEDKLMEEIEQSRTAQLANINKLKNSPVNPVSKKDNAQQQKESKEQINGYKVRIVNLPKKMNVHKDLQLAFKGVPGMINIVPVVSGNKKTRDPVCKGLAFVYFRQESDAHRFVQNFSGKSINFGKAQKQIKCDMDNGLSEPGDEKSPKKSSSTAQLQIVNLDSSEVNVSEKHEGEDETLESADPGEIGENSETRRVAESQDVDDKEVRKEMKSTSPKKKGISKKEKQLAPKSKKQGQKVLKFNVPGSAKRLKIKEKELLTGAFSKYGARSSLATSEQS